MSEPMYEAMRRAMVASQLRTTGVNDARVLAAMAAVPRELYVPADQAALAYRDTAVPLAPGRALPPAAVLGRLLTELRLRPSDNVLLVGAGSGYAAAVTALLVRRVVALEEDGAIAAGPVPDTVERVAGPLAAGWAPGAPYDIVLFDGAVEEVPPAIVEQMTSGGSRVAVPLLHDGVARLSIGHRAFGTVGYLSLADAAVPVLPGFARPPAFTF